MVRMGIDVIVMILIKIGVFLLGVVVGLAIYLLLGPAGAVLIPFFLSGNRELNEFWLGYIIGCGIAYYLEGRALFRFVSNLVNRRVVWGS